MYIYLLYPNMLNEIKSLNDFNNLLMIFIFWAKYDFYDSQFPMLLQLVRLRTWK